MITRDPDTNKITSINLTRDYLCNGEDDKPCLVKIEQLKLTNGIDLRIETVMLKMQILSSCDF